MSDAVSLGGVFLAIIGGVWKVGSLLERFKGNCEAANDRLDGHEKRLDRLELWQDRHTEATHDVP